MKFDKYRSSLIFAMTTISVIFILGVSSNIFRNYSSLFWKTEEGTFTLLDGHVGSFFGEMVGSSIWFILFYVILRKLSKPSDIKYQKILTNIVYFSLFGCLFINLGLSLYEDIEKIYQIFGAATILTILMIYPRLFATKIGVLIIFAASQIFHLSEWNRVLKYLMF